MTDPIVNTQSYPVLESTPESRLSDAAAVILHAFPKRTEHHPTVFSTGMVRGALEKLVLKAVDLDPNDRIKELICELAERETRLAMSNEPVYVTHENGDTSYTDEAQNIFNDLYDEYEKLLNQYGIHDT